MQIKPCLVSFVVLFTCNARAATVEWTGAGGDNLWWTPANWSSGAVPGTADDVIINVPGDATVIVRMPGPNVQSIACSESFVLESGVMSVKGASEFTGPFEMRGGQLTALDNTAQVDVTGPVTISGGLLEGFNGGQIRVTSPSVTVNLINEAGITARGAGSAVLLQNAREIVANLPGKGFAITSGGAGHVDCPNLQNISRTEVSTSYGGLISLPSLTNAYFSKFSTGIEGKLSLPGLTRLEVVNAPLTFSVLGAGSEISATNLTSIAGHTAAFGGVGFRFSAFGGGRINLSGLTNAAGSIEIGVSQLNSVVDLSGIRGVLASPAGAMNRFVVIDGGVIQMPEVTGLKRATVEVVGTGALQTGPLTVAEDVSFNVSQGAAVGLTNVTELVLNIANVELFASDAGSVIDLSSVTNVINPSGKLLQVSVWSGGAIDLHKMQNPPAVFRADANSGSLDFSGFAGELRGAELSAGLDASIHIPNVTSLRGGRISVVGNGQIVSGEWSSIDDCSFNVWNGAKLWLTNITALAVTNPLLSTVMFNVSGAGAELHLPDLTDVKLGPKHLLWVQAQEGGLVSLPNLRTVTGGMFRVLAAGLESLVNLSHLTAVTTAPNPITRQFPGSAFSEFGGGEILLNDIGMLLSGVTFSLSSNPNDLLPSSGYSGTNLLLYARPWSAYLVESRDTRDANSDWQLYARVAATNAVQFIAPPPSNNVAFRVTELIAEPPALNIAETSGGEVQLTLFGTPGQSYRLETKSDLGGVEAWQEGPTISLTNAFHVLPASASAPSPLFHRARRL